MAVIERGNLINASAGGGVLESAGAPGAGTNAVQTLTIGGTPTGGTFKLAYEGNRTAAITWSATNSTLLANINTALDALPGFTAGDLVATAGTLTAGIGTILITAAGTLARQPVTLLTVDTNSLTGTTPTLAIATTTAGVAATGRGSGKGTFLTDTTNGIAYINTGTAYTPTWTKIGTQT